MISETLIQEIKYRNNIEEVISSYISLKRAGANMVSSCPFHSEKTPSFTVFTNNNNFYCFGCGAGGDVITFTMKIENLDYISAVEFLAKRAGISISEYIKDDTNHLKKSHILNMNRDAAKFFHNELTTTATGKAAMDYLKNRALSFAVIKRFGLGYACNNYRRLTDYMHTLGYKDSELHESSLCGISKKNNMPYDYFRNRIIFPIIDVAGNIVAFGGRVMDDSLPKYLNSSDTLAFKKSRSLFGLNFAKKSCNDTLILCEGYMDVVTLNAVGFSNSVATLGTAITPDQARLIEKYTKTVIVAYDSDNAGKKAAYKAIKLLSEVGLEVKVLSLFDSKDPDEYIKKHGAEKFNIILQQSSSQFDFKFNNIIKKYNIDIMDDKIKALHEICQVVSEIYSEVERDIYISKISNVLEVPSDSLKNDIKHIIFSKKRNQKKEFLQQTIKKSEGYADRINPDFIKNVRASNAEEAIIGILLLYPEFIQKIKDNELTLITDDFFTDFGKRIFNNIISKYSSDTLFDYGILGNNFTPDEMGRITKMIILRKNLSVNDINVLNDNIATLKDEKRKKLLDEVSVGSIENLLDFIKSKKNKGF